MRQRRTWFAFYRHRINVIGFKELPLLLLSSLFAGGLLAAGVLLLIYFEPPKTQTSPERTLRNVRLNAIGLIAFGAAGLSYGAYTAFFYDPKHTHRENGEKEADNT